MRWSTINYLCHGLTITDRNITVKILETLLLLFQAQRHRSRQVCQRFCPYLEAADGTPWSAFGNVVASFTVTALSEY